MTEAATKLAEKYLDFQTLVQLCEVTKNQERLDQYIQKFAEHVSSLYVLKYLHHYNACFTSYFM